MTVIGLDLSLTAPGWFKYERSSERSLLDHGTYYPKPKGGMTRIHEIANFVRSLLPFDPENCLVLIEGFSHASRGAAVGDIYGLGYIVRYSLWYRHFRFVEVAPNALKKFATGNGSSKPKKDGTAAATKEVVIREVYKRWNVNVGDNNEADAYVLGRIGMHLAQVAPSEELTAFQRDVLKGIKY